MTEDKKDISNEIEDIKGRDLSPAEMEKYTKPKKTWFFERLGDGFIFPCEEREAWDICYNKSTWKRRDFRLVGTSNGETYNRIIKESMSKVKELEPIINEKKEELSKYMRAEEKLIMDEAVDMEGDPNDTENEANKKKVLRIRAIMDRLHNELDKLDDEYRTVSSGVVKKATEAELDVAIKNQEERKKNGEELDWPDSDANIITPDSNPKSRRKILNLMQGRN